MTPAQELVWKLIDRSITSQEFEELEELLLRDPELRQYYQECLETDSTFAQIAISKKKDSVEPSAFRTRVSRPGYAAAVGAVAGILSTSAVFGFVVPKVTDSAPRFIAVVQRAFENPAQTFEDGFSKYANVWFFQGNHVVEAPTEVAALEGEHVLKLSAKAEQRNGLAYYMVDLDEFPEVRSGANSRILATSSFLADAPGHGDRYSIRIAAFSEPPANIGPIWKDESQLYARTLQHMSRGVFTRKRDEGWTNLTAEMNIPEGTRTLIISLSAGHGRNEDTSRSHFLDSISVKFLLNSPVY